LAVATLETKIPATKLFPETELPTHNNRIIVLPAEDLFDAQAQADPLSLRYLEAGSQIDQGTLDSLACEIILVNEEEIVVDVQKTYNSLVEHRLDND
jgi:hypothetical protein